MTPEENKKTFGKDYNLHGHSYVGKTSFDLQVLFVLVLIDVFLVEVTVKGPVDPVTGMVISITTLKEIIHVKQTN